MTDHPITIEEMCAAMPQAFTPNAKPLPASQTLDQWAAAQGIVHVVQKVITEPLTPLQVKRRRFNAHMSMTA